MKSLTPILILAAAAGCSTTGPSPKAEAPRSVAVQFPVPTDLQSERVVIRSVHGQVQYWDGKFWAGLRPNTVLSNGVQIRPGADSCVDLCGGHIVSMRVMADHSQNVKAFLVHRARVSQQTPFARSSGATAIACSVQEPCAAQMAAGAVMGPGAAADVAIGADGNVRVITGELTLTGNGKTYLLHDGQSFDANTGDVRGETRSKPGLTPFASRTFAWTDLASGPHTVLFDGGLENARRGICSIGD